MGSIPQSGIGTLVYINASLPATETLSGFQALTGWVEIGEINQGVGDLGWQKALIERFKLADGRATSVKGKETAKSIPFSVNYTSDDAGLIDVQEAYASDADYSFRIIAQDTTTYYFSGTVYDFTVNAGTESAIGSAKFSVQPNTYIYEGAGTAIHKVTFSLTGSGAALATLIGEAVQYVTTGQNSAWVHAVLDASDTIAWSPTPGGGGATATTVRATSVSDDVDYVGTVTAV